jgi:hypothetical protein
MKDGGELKGFYMRRQFLLLEISTSVFSRPIWASGGRTNRVWVRLVRSHHPDTGLRTGYSWERWMGQSLTIDRISVTGEGNLLEGSALEREIF